MRSETINDTDDSSNTIISISHRRLKVMEKSATIIYPCTDQDCLKEFNNKWSLLRHMKTHTGEKLFQCKFCGSKFVQNCSLKRHENTHMNEKCWICLHQNCGKRFKLKEYLEAHVRTHIQCKPDSVSKKHEVALEIKSSDIR